MPYKDPAEQRRNARAHYAANKDVYKERATIHRKKTRADIKALIRAAKDRPCVDCGVRYPYYVMQFDHIGEKDFTIGLAARRSISPARIAAEIERCEVVRANCHAERTHQRGQSISVQVVVPKPGAPVDDTLF